MVCYDDRFIVKLAFESDGVVVSNDTYRDLQGERQEWKRFIEERLLMYSFVNDKYVTAGDWLCWAHRLGCSFRGDMGCREQAKDSETFLIGSLGLEASLRENQYIPRWLSQVGLGQHTSQDALSLPEILIAPSLGNALKVTLGYTL